MGKLPLALLLGLVALFVSTTFVLAAKPSEISTPSGKLKACQAQEAAIKNRSLKIAALTDNISANFNTKAAKVEEFYNSKMVPQGKLVANYDALVSDITTKQASAQAALQTVKNQAADFSCNSGDPREQLSTFRKNMQAVKGALKDYRNSIKNLIVAIRSVTGQENSSEGGKPSMSPQVKPSKSPNSSGNGQRRGGE